MPFTVPLTTGQTGTWAELLALQVEETEGAMFDRPNEWPPLSGPAPVGTWIMRHLPEGPRMTQGPRLDHETGPWRPMSATPFVCSMRRYDPVAHVVPGGCIDAVGLWSIMARAGAMLNGAGIACNHDHSSDIVATVGPNETARPYYVIQDGAIARGPSGGNPTRPWAVDADSAVGYRTVYRFTSVPDTWNPADLIQGPVPLPMPTVAVPRCPLCRRVRGVCNTPECQGPAIGEALGAFALGDTCQRCQRPVWRTDIEPVPLAHVRGSIKECASCRGKRRAAPLNGVPLDVLRFGVEIETEGISYESNAREVATKRLGKRLGLAWDARHDGSLRGPHAEFCSPPLSFDETSLDELKAAVRRIRRAGALVSERCGLHVHVDVSALTPKHLWSLARHWNEAQHVVLAALPPLDYRRHFCEPIGAGTVLSAERLASAGVTSPRDWAALTPRRYATLNYAAMARHGTVEFRLFNGSNHAGQIAAYVRLCAHTVSWATCNVDTLVTPRTSDRAGMVRLLDDLGIACKSARYHLLGKWKTPDDRPLPATVKKEEAA